MTVYNRRQKGNLKMFLVRKIIVSWEKLITTNVPVVFGKMERIEASRQHCENW